MSLKSVTRRPVFGSCTAKESSNGFPARATVGFKRIISGYSIRSGSFATSCIRQRGHMPGCDDCTSGCIGQEKTTGTSWSLLAEGAVGDCAITLVATNTSMRQQRQMLKLKKGAMVYFFACNGTARWSFRSFADRNAAAAASMELHCGRKWPQAEN